MRLAQLTLLLTQSPRIITNHIFASGAVHTWVSYFKQRLKVSHKTKEINPGHDMLSHYSKDQSTSGVAVLILLLLQGVPLVESLLRQPQQKLPQGQALHSGELNPGCP